MPSSSSKNDFNVGIVGAGLSGIILAIHLKKAGFHNFTIYERDEDVGGTWLTNQYPGCRCDVPAHWYSLSTHLNPNWTQSHPPQSEILAYWMDIVSKENIRPYIQLKTAFVSAEWNADEKVYDCVMQKGTSVNTPVCKEGRSGKLLEHGEDLSAKAEEEMLGEKKETFKVKHNVLIQAVGGFSIPLVPKIKGLRYNAWESFKSVKDKAAIKSTSADNGEETFQGTVIHPARWPREGINLKGKKVAVIGNGCSGTQIVCALSMDESIQLYPVIRNAQWYLKKANPTIPENWKQLYRRFPLLLRLVRFLVYLRMDIGWYIFRYKAGAWARAIAEKRFKEDMKTRAPEGLAEALTPKYPLGTKRIVNDMGFIDALSKPNVEAITGGIERLSKDSIVFSNGRVVPVDVIVIATGFDTTGSSLDITGPTGMTLAKASIDTDSTGAYHGLGLEGLPNVFTMLGNNVAPSHASVIFQLEVQAGYMKQIVCGMNDNDVKVLEVNPAANRQYNGWLDKRLADTVWMHGPSFYRGGKNRDGKVFTNWPAMVAEYWRQNTKPKWGDWVGGEKIAAKQAQETFFKRVLMFVSAAMLLFGARAVSRA